MRIAMLGHKRIPSREGGIEIVVEELSTRMAASGHTVTVYNRGGHHVSGKHYDRKTGKYYRGVRIKTVPTNEKNHDSKYLCISILAMFGRWKKTGKPAYLYMEDEVTTLPFEMLKVPVPKDYKQALEFEFGDWNKFVKGGSIHGDIIFDTSEGYEVLLQKLYPEVVNH